MSPVEPTDDSLVARVKAGEAEAFAILAERHRAGLVRLATLLLGDFDEAESIAQEASPGRSPGSPATIPRPRSSPGSAGSC